MKVLFCTLVTLNICDPNNLTWISLLCENISLNIKWYTKAFSIIVYFLFYVSNTSIVATTNCFPCSIKKHSRVKINVAMGTTVVK